MSTHSPGPWYFDKSDCAIYQVDGQYVAAFSDCDVPYAADCRLMAAAPDLLEACELLLSQVQCSGAWCGFPCCNTCDAIRQANAAIQKARGEL